jgi:hypothetical protein
LKTLFSAAVIASSFAFLAGDSLAQASVQSVKPEVVRLDGCPVQVSESCIMLLDPRGTPYDITAAPAWANVKSAKKALQEHRAIRLTGTFAEGQAGSCRRGVVLKDIRWSFSDHKCASPAPAPVRKP